MGLNLLAGLVILLLAALGLVFYGYRFRERSPEAREIPVFDGLADEVGRAAEEGTLIHVTLGSGSLTGENAMTSVAALEGLMGIFDLSAAYDTPPIVTAGDPTLYLLADDWMRRAYARLGNVQRYRPTLVQFMASSPVSYAALAATYLFESGVGSNVMVGAFDQEASLLADAAARRGTYSAGGATSSLALGALFPALGSSDLVIGEDLFAAGAETIDKPVYWAGLWTQELLRWVIILGIIALAVLSFLGLEVG